jgi:hypothetical protein
MIPKEATLVEEIKNIVEEASEMQEKLILDQPDQVTSSGKIEHVASNHKVSINEESPKEIEQNEKLISEDPLSGVVILRD